LLHIWERHNGANNGQIVYAVRDAVQIGLSKATAARALTEAIELGFLRVTRSSSFTFTREGEAAAALMDELNDLVDTIFVELSSEETARLPDQVWDLLGRIIGPDDGE
jgi:hypothetical protein